MSTTRRSIRRSARRTTRRSIRRSGLPARCTFVAAVLGGALLVPTAAFAYPDPAPAPAYVSVSASASAPASSGTSEQADGSHGQNALFLAAGGGMAAAGAAGLAYAMYRRGRSDG
ncbi:hypothetical protein ACFVTY_13985 [Streptomyces sp. NPDC058067]|uniref:hypothetical protein n=1 Tax=Streptomyces sp. NPDC058067 TaxID=3346324 RepID=UPI0036E318DF